MTEAAHRFAKDHLKAFVERIERLEEEKKTLADDIRDVFAEAKANGFDTKAMREIVRRRKMDATELQERDAILETYMLALGMIPGGSSSGSAAGGSGGSAPRTRPTGPQASAALAQAMADDGLISQEAATETARIGEAIDRMEERTIARLAANPQIRAAFKKLGTPVDVTEGERAKGFTAAFIGKDGTRMAIGAGTTKPCAAQDNSISARSVLAPLFPGEDEPPPHLTAHGRAETSSASSRVQTAPDDEDQPHPVDPAQRRIPDNPDGADDIGPLPPFLRRDANNRAPFMERPPQHAPGEPRAPP